MVHLSVQHPFPLFVVTASFLPWGLSLFHFHQLESSPHHFPIVLVQLFLQFWGCPEVFTSFLMTLVGIYRSELLMKFVRASPLQYFQAFLLHRLSLLRWKICPTDFWPQSFSSKRWLFGDCDRVVAYCVLLVVGGKGSLGFMRYWLTSLVSMTVFCFHGYILCPLEGCLPCWHLCLKSKLVLLAIWSL